MKFYDTNAILRNYKYISENFMISSVTLMELESIKTSYKKDEATKYSARKAVSFLKKNPSLYNTMVVDDHTIEVLHEFHLPDTPDNEICCCAYLSLREHPDLEFITDDLCCMTIASKVFHLRTRDELGFERVYKGYKEFKGNTAEINDYMENVVDAEWYQNEYLLLYNTDDDSCGELRYDKGKFVPLKLPNSNYIKGKNNLQRCALDILYNKNISIAAILGGYGSGKTYLSMRMSVYEIQKSGNFAKILGVREVSGEGREVGYLPGSIDDKTDKFFEPLSQQLDFANFDFDRMKEEGTISTTIPYYMKGTTYNDTIILVDEAEDLTEKQIKLIGTRLGDNSKIILAGDYKQSVVNTTTDNPLVRTCNELKGNKDFACIYLGEDVRSEASKLFANLFESEK